MSLSFAAKDNADIKDIVKKESLISRSSKSLKLIDHDFMVEIFKDG